MVPECDCASVATKPAGSLMTRQSMMAAHPTGEKSERQRPVNRHMGMWHPLDGT